MGNNNLKNSSEKSPRVLNQYLAAFTASLSAFSTGNTLAWTSPATPLLVKGLAGFPITERENSWIGSLMPIGAAVSCVPFGYLVDKVGRKWTLFGLAPLSILGWGLLTWGNSVYIFYIGRFITGMTSGAASVIVPVYTAEICHKSIRGTIGSIYQLFIVMGVLFMYVIGTQMSLFWFTATACLVPIIFGVLFLTFPDTPIYYINQNNLYKARESLLFFRGPKYDIETELVELTKAKVTDEAKQTESMWKVFQTKSAVKSVTISISMMIFEQFIGIKPIVFYPTSIFQEAGYSLSPEYCTIVLGVQLVLSTLGATFLTDRLGRKVLLTTSAGIMFICTLGIGLFFYCLSNGYYVEQIRWLPLLLLCLYIIVYSLGYGPLPWIVMAEIVPRQIKGLAISVACVISWFCAFATAKFYTDIVPLYGTHTAFWSFALMSAGATIFSWYIIPETKGKTFEQIQDDLKRSRSEKRLIKQLHQVMKDHLNEIPPRRYAV